MSSYYDASTPPREQSALTGLEPGSDSGAADPAAGAPSRFDLAWAERTYSATSPAERVFVRMRGDTDLTVTFMPGWYRRATPTEMETELARAAKMAFVERTRAYYAVRSELAGHRVRPATTIHSDDQARWRRRLEELPARGESSDGSVAMTMVGTTHYGVDVAPGTLSTLSEGAFAVACQEAGLACLADHTRAWQELHFDVYTRPRLEKAGVVVP